MAEYLVDNPPRIRQFRQPRRATPSGVVVVHTAESFPDESGPDDGALNVARFIENRTNYGSYHDLADSDSWLRLVPYNAEAFGDGTGSNPHAYHVSAATQAAKWDQLGDDWVDGCVWNMAKAAANYARWVKAERGVTIPARRISRAQSEARIPGFISHAQRDPARRTDPGKGFPWTPFLTYYAAELAGTPTEKDWFDMFDNEAEFKAAVVEAIRPMALRIEESIQNEAKRDAAAAERAHLVGKRIEELFRIERDGRAELEAAVAELRAALLPTPPTPPEA